MPRSGSGPGRRFKKDQLPRGCPSANARQLRPVKPKRAFIFHGYLSSPNEAWLPWLRGELEERGYLVSLPHMPHPDRPVISEWIDFIAKLVGEPDDGTTLIGHSIGCQGILRYLEILGAAGKSVAKTVLVAGFFPTGMSPADAELETGGNPALVPWFIPGLDAVKVKIAAGNCTVFLSDNDPYIGVDRAKAVFRATLDPKIVIEHGYGHFNEDDRVVELPSVLAAVIS
jgi:predicted alpha/beta hydrolase family esterase